MTATETGPITKAWFRFDLNRFQIEWSFLISGKLSEVDMLEDAFGIPGINVDMGTDIAKMLLKKPWMWMHINKWRWMQNAALGHDQQLDDYSAIRLCT
ncbi:hypothetical protein RIF29_09739 [Crotalaria pallida]|uniref:Uncharacterized protein n=1 Tax=Crotalaria pallida TaxID=3830 RepID=A0AAN9IJS1_CROPI